MPRRQLARAGRGVARWVDERISVGRGEGMVALIYHRVGARSPSPVDFPVAQFRDQLDALASVAVRSLDDALAPAHDGTPSVVLTFDDGTVDWPEVVLPELVARRLPATFYVATDFVESERMFPDEGRPASWAGLADMVSTGLVTIGSHTHTHRVLAHADAATAAEELDRSTALIEDRLGVACDHFAYPKAIAPSPAAEVVVRRRFRSAVLAGNRANGRGADRHRLGRHALTVADDAASFQRKVAGGACLEGWLRERRDALRSTTDY